MRYIIKGNRIYGIYNQNYSSLTGKPSINNIELAEGVSYSSEDLGIVVGPISQAVYDAMPTHNPETIYVVYDDEIDPSSNTINYNDLENKPQINGQTLTGNKSLSSLNIYSKEEVRNLIAAGRSILVVSTKPTNPTPNTLYYVETSTQSVYHVYLYDSNTQEADLGLSTIDLSDYYTKTQADDKFEILTNKVNTITSASTATEYPSAKATFDYAAPLQSSFANGGDGSQAYDPNNCVFNLTRIGTTTRAVERRIYSNVVVSKSIMGISSGNWFGAMEVMEIKQALAGTVVIYNTLYATADSVSGVLPNNQYVFRRIGWYNANDNLVYDNRTNITWKNWYPLEYPQTGLKDLINTTDFSCTAFNLTVSGGIAMYDIYNLNPKNASGIKDIISQENISKYSSLQKTNARAWLFDTASNKNILYLESDIGQAIKTSGYSTAGANYRGSFSIPLGY